jgi:hypothetical protein
MHPDTPQQNHTQDEQTAQQHCVQALQKRRMMEKGTGPWCTCWCPLSIRRYRHFTNQGSQGPLPVAGLDCGAAPKSAFGGCWHPAGATHALFRQRTHETPTHMQRLHVSQNWRTAGLQVLHSWASGSAGHTDWAGLHLGASVRQKRVSRGKLAQDRAVQVRPNEEACPL